MEMETDMEMVAAAPAEQPAAEQPAAEHRRQPPAEIFIQVANLEDQSPPSTPPAHPDGDRIGDSEESAESKESTLILLDWDDTLLVSSLLSSLGFRIDEDSELPAALRSELSELEAIVIHMLEACNACGNVVIVTNAETGWVEMSGKRFVPRILDAVQRMQLPVISARSTYEARYPGSPCDWKTAAFIAQVQHAAQASCVVDVISIGDSLHEREAAHQVSARFRDSIATVKTVKMVERPTVEQLRRQLSLVATNLRDMVEESHSFDVNLVCDAAA